MEYERSVDRQAGWIRDVDSEYWFVGFWVFTYYAVVGFWGVGYRQQRRVR
jgi:hypothetical protein